MLVFKELARINNKNSNIVNVNEITKFKNKLLDILNNVQKNSKFDKDLNLWVCIFEENPIEKNIKVAKKIFLDWAKNNQNEDIILFAIGKSEKTAKAIGVKFANIYTYIEENNSTVEDLMQYPLYPILNNVKSKRKLTEYIYDYFDLDVGEEFKQRVLKTLIKNYQDESIQSCVIHLNEVKSLRKIAIAMDLFEDFYSDKSDDNSVILTLGDHKKYTVIAVRDDKKVESLWGITKFQFEKRYPKFKSILS